MRALLTTIVLVLALSGWGVVSVSTAACFSDNCPSYDGSASNFYQQQLQQQREQAATDQRNRDIDQRYADQARHQEQMRQQRQHDLDQQYRRYNFQDSSGRNQMCTSSPYQTFCQ
jgi:hypothetical protein